LLRLSNRTRKNLLIGLVLLLPGILFFKAILLDTYIQGRDGILRDKNVLPVFLSKYIDRELDYSWANENRFIAHALGGIEGFSYTNSKEAFIKNYAVGHRVFEVDLIFTADEKLVCSHGWNNYVSPPNLIDFLNTKIQGTFTPLALIDLFILLRDYPDTFLVTDTKSFKKNDVRSTFQAIIDTANGLAPEILERIIPQIYSEKMLKYIEEIYPFNSYIYTLYLSRSSKQRVIDFATENGIRVITMPKHRISSKSDSKIFINTLKKKRIYTYLHPINEKKEILFFETYGPWGFYTAFLAPEPL